MKWIGKNRKKAYEKWNDTNADRQVNVDTGVLLENCVGSLSLENMKLILLIARKT